MRRSWVRLAAALLGVAVLAACEQTVPPQLTNPAIDDWLDVHVVESNPFAAPSGRLLVLLPGSYEHPSDMRRILTESANDGTPAIGLQTPNTFNVYDLCNADPSCEEQLRLEVIDGVDRTPLVDVTPANSIIGRLVSLLQHLDATDPMAFGTFGWGAFLDGDQPRWSSIVLAGFSQGGSNAALMARDHEVARAVLLAAPNDTDGQGTLAPWITGPHVTPSDRYFGFTHTGDPNVGAIEASWAALGATGPRTSVDGAVPPYGDSHELTTGIATTDPHRVLVLDDYTPVDASGVPVFAPVWQYLCCRGF